MTKIKKVLSGFIGVCLLTALPLAQAQDAPKWHPGQRIQEIYRQLNLTDDQKEQLEANKQQNRTKMENARQEMKVYKETLKNELMKPQLDMPKINQIHDQIKSLQNKMEDDKLNSVLAVRAILTQEQFLKFVALMHKHKQEQEHGE